MNNWQGIEVKIQILGSRERKKEHWREREMRRCRSPPVAVTPGRKLTALCSASNVWKGVPVIMRG
jgi:hypothetical protein